jgi:hypothetical protein
MYVALITIKTIQVISKYILATLKLEGAGSLGRGRIIALFTRSAE